MDIVLFEQALSHIIKIARVITTPFGHSLCVGIGGSGRKSLASLASHIVGYNVSSIVLDKNYKEENWFIDLQNLFILCGVEDRNVVFLFNDTQVFNESIIEQICSIL